MISIRADKGTAGGNGMDAWLSPGRFALLLILCLAASFPEVLFGNQTFVARDFGLFSYPIAYYHKECIWRGEFPLWNPLHNCGVPFLAQWNTMTLYPLDLIYLLLPLGWSLDFFCIAHLFVAGMGMYFLCERWTGSRFGAAVAGIAFALNGLSLNLLQWPSHVATYAWMPWVIWSVEQGWQRGGRRLVLAAIIGAMQMLGGGPETIMLTWLILLGLWLVQWLAGREPRWPMTARLAAIVALVSGLAAAQLLPFLDLLAHAQRTASYASTGWSMPPGGWANFFVPLTGSFLLRKGFYAQDNQFWTSSYYVGIAVAVLALAALWRVRNRRVWGLGLLALLGVLLAMGQNGFALKMLRAVFPGLGFMTHPVKFVLLTIFALPVLAAYGVKELQRLAEAAPAQVRRLVLTLGLLAGLLVAGVLVYARIHPADQEVWSTTLWNGAGRVAFLAASLGGFFALSLLAGRRLQHLVCVAVVAVGWLDVLTHAPTQNPTAHRSVLEPGQLKLSPHPKHGTSRVFVSFPAITKMLYGTTGEAEKDFLLHRQGLFLDSNLLEDIPTIGGFYSLYLGTDTPIRGALGGHGDSMTSPLADFMGIAWENDTNDVFSLVARTNWLPMLTAGQQPVFADDTITLAALEGKEFDPKRLVYLSLEAKGTITVTNAAEARILSQKIAAQQLEVEVEAPQPALLVVAQTYYHPWQAWVNERAVSIHRANYHFQALEVPAGKSHVRMEYADGRFQAGAALSGVSLLICAGLWLFGPRAIASRRMQNVQS